MRARPPYAAYPLLQHGCHAVFRRRKDKAARVVVPPPVRQRRAHVLLHDHRVRVHIDAEELHRGARHEQLWEIQREEVRDRLASDHVRRAVERDSRGVAFGCEPLRVLRESSADAGGSRKANARQASAMNSLLVRVAIAGMSGGGCVLIRVAANGAKTPIPAPSPRYSGSLRRHICAPVAIAQCSFHPY